MLRTSLLIVAVFLGLWSITHDLPVFSQGICAPDPTESLINIEEQNALDAINAERATMNILPLAQSTELMRAATMQSYSMADDNYISHTNIDGRDPGQRMVACGMPVGSFWGENIAAGYATGESVWSGWDNSPAHHAIMLDAHYTYAGIAVAYNQNSSYGYYWTLDVATLPSRTPTVTITPTSTRIIPTPTAVRTTTPTAQPLGPSGHIIYRQRSTPTPIPINR